MDDVIVDENGNGRCAWSAGASEYRAYHDGEWGRPVSDDRRVYEKLCLEGFQAGLSWITILRKREAFREAFAHFDPIAVADFDETAIDALVANPRIVRHRAKILAVVTNARATIALWDEGLSLAGLLWRHRPEAARVPTGREEVPASTPESAALSGELRRRGFSFVGPTTVYSVMQALGVVNDHLEACHWRSVVEKDRSQFRVPPLERST